MSISPLQFTLLLVLVLLFGALIGRRVRRWTMRKYELPCCGNCGHCVRGLESHVCTECGSNLIEVGVIANQQLRSTSTFSSAILWSLLCVIATALLVPFFGRISIPVVWSGRQAMTISQPASGTHQAVLLSQTFETDGGQAIDNQINCEFFGATGNITASAVLVVDLGDRTAHLMSGDQEFGRDLPLSNPTILRWFKENGIEGPEEVLNHEADAILLMIRFTDWTRIMPRDTGSFLDTWTSDEPLGAYRSVSITSNGHGQYSVAWNHILLLLLPFVVWAGGVALIFRGKRNRSDPNARSSSRMKSTHEAPRP